MDNFSDRLVAAGTEWRGERWEGEGLLKGRKNGGRERKQQEWGKGKEKGKAEAGWGQTREKAGKKGDPRYLL